MSAEPSSAQAAPAQGKTPGLRAHIQNVYRLIIKELRSIRSDPMMLVLVAYAFSVAVYMIATGASTFLIFAHLGVLAIPPLQACIPLSARPRKAAGKPKKAEALRSSCRVTASCHEVGPAAK